MQYQRGLGLGLATALINAYELSWIMGIKLQTVWMGGMGLGPYRKPFPAEFGPMQLDMMVVRLDIQTPP